MYEEILKNPGRKLARDKFKPHQHSLQWAKLAHTIDNAGVIPICSKGGRQWS